MYSANNTVIKQLETPEKIESSDFDPFAIRISRIFAQVFRPKTDTRVVKLYVSYSINPEIALDRTYQTTVFFNMMSEGNFKKSVLRNSNKINIETRSHLLRMSEKINQTNSDLRLIKPPISARNTIGYLSIKPKGQGTLNFYEYIAVLLWEYNKDSRLLKPVLMLSIRDDLLEIELEETWNENIRAAQYIGHYDPYDLLKKAKELKLQQKRTST
jgi:hypothetical protein